MFYGFLLVLLVITSVVLVLAILAQAGKGGGLAASFGGAGSSESFMGTRQASNLFIKASWYAGAAFLGLSYILSMASNRQGTPGSVLDNRIPPAVQTPAAPPAGVPSILSPDTSGGKAADPAKAAPPPAGKSTDTSKAPGI